MARQDHAQGLAPMVSPPPTFRDVPRKRGTGGQRLWQVRGWTFRATAERPWVKKRRARRVNKVARASRRANRR